MMTRKFIFVDVVNNNNKYWNATDNDDGTWTVHFGRVGHAGTRKNFNNSSKPMSKAIAGKLKKGYTEVKTVTVDSLAAPMSGSLNDIVSEQIVTRDTETRRLINKLVQQNIHDITSNTGIEYKNGNLITPMGLIDINYVQEARKILDKIGVKIDNNANVDPRLVNDYMRLIPQDLGFRRIDVSRVFPNISAVKKQNSMLDAIEAQIENARNEARDGNIEVKRTFDVDLSLVDDKIMEYIKSKYNKTRKSGHVSHKLEPVRAWNVDIKPMREAFEADGANVGNVRKLWHGTRTPNLLSILSKGLIIPPENARHCTGRMFGNGVYFSDQSTKSLNYSYGYWGGTKTNNCYMFIADVAMGNPYVPNGPTRKNPPSGYDSYLAKANVSGVLNNEMIVFRTSQVNLRWLIEFG